VYVLKLKWILNRFIILWIILFFFLISAYGEHNQDQKGLNTINGYVKDAETGEVLIGAHIFVRELKTGTNTNDYGFYSISLKNGTYFFIFSFIGYNSIIKKITINKTQTIKIELKSIPEKIKEVIVKAETGNKNISRIETGMERLHPKIISKIPSLLGEPDLIKVLQLLPGVQFIKEGNSGYSIRGGSSDQNLILMDEATVYNATHLMGFLSSFNNDAVNDLKLYKGDIPASYGGRISSILDVRMKDGNPHKISGKGGIGLLSARFTLDGPIKKDKTTFLASARRTYLDLFLPLSNNKNISESKLYFYDLNFKLSHKINEKNKLFINTYFGNDKMGSSDFKLNFGNKIFSFRWNHIFDAKLFMNATTVCSKYNYELGTNVENETDSWLWNSNIQEIGQKFDFSCFIRPEMTLRFGLQSFIHEFNPGSIRGLDENSIYQTYSVEKNRALEHSLYLSFESKIQKKINIRAGLRGSLFQNIGETTVYKYNSNHEVSDSTHYSSGNIFKSYFGIEPRLEINYMPKNDWSVKFSYNRNHQYIQKASGSMASTPLDIWFTSGCNIKPQIGDQLTIGSFKNFRNEIYQTSIELFYKKMRNTIDFADHADLLLNKYLEGEIRTGRSNSYGIELSVKKTKGLLTGWIGYTYSRAKRTIPEINQGKTYIAPFDKPNYFTIVFNYKLSPRTSLSANWIYASGQPTSTPEQYYKINGTLIPLYGERNAGRYDPYHRLDLSFILKCKNEHHKKWQGEWIFSIYNVYNQKNAWLLRYRQNKDNPSESYTEKTYLFPIIPSVTYNFKF